MIHEYGHLYEDMLDRNPTDIMRAVAERAKTWEIEPQVRRASMSMEAFAQWCELKASEILYPDHYDRLIEQAQGTERDTDSGHNAGLRLAISLIEEEVAIKE